MQTADDRPAASHLVSSLPLQPVVRHHARRLPNSGDRTTHDESWSDSLPRLELGQSPIRAGGIRGTRKEVERRSLRDAGKGHGRSRDQGCGRSGRPAVYAPDRGPGLCPGTVGSLERPVQWTTDSPTSRLENVRVDPMISVTHDPQAGCLRIRERQPAGERQEVPVRIEAARREVTPGLFGERAQLGRARPTRAGSRNLPDRRRALPL